MTQWIKKHPLKLFFLLLFLGLVVLHQWLLSFLGNFLVLDQTFKQVDVAIVLNTGVEIYPRLIEAADLYNKGKVKKIVINGNRKTAILKQLEAMGYQPANPWYENRLRVLEMLGVPRNQVITISGEDVYDTVSEARLVGDKLRESDVKSIVITTSKSHTRRAAHIWKNLFSNDFIIYAKSARSDPFDPKSWWQDGRQIRWVMAEYGGWLFMYWKQWLVK
jgi:uncharacterized SAM-binding protein YcdF (DUF218 family)